MKKDITHSMMQHGNWASLDGLYRLIWLNFRDENDTENLRLTQYGFHLLSSHISFYTVKVTNHMNLSSSETLILNRRLKCPWYLYQGYIHLFDESTSYLLILMDGDLKKFCEIEKSSYN